MKWNETIRSFVLFIYMASLMFSYRFFLTFNIPFALSLMPLSFIFLSIKGTEFILSGLKFKQRQNIIKILIISWLMIIFFYSLDFNNYVCLNVDNIAQVRILRYVSGAIGNNWLDSCETIPEEVYNKEYWAGFFNGSYNLTFYKIIGKIQNLFSMSPEHILPLISFFFLSITIYFSYKLNYEIFDSKYLLPIFVLVFYYENLGFIIWNGWFMQNVMNSIILFFGILIIKQVKGIKYDKLIFSLSISILILIILLYKIYNINFLIFSPDRMFNNVIDIYRIIYSANIFLVPAITSFLINKSK